MNRDFLKLLGIIFAIFFIALPVAMTSELSKDKSQPAEKLLNYPLTRITDKMYIIYGPFSLPGVENQGYRNNPLIILTNEGVVVCDPGGSASAGKMVVEKVKTLTNKPIVAVFDSHAHGDHWLGNEAIKDAYPDVSIYGHKLMKTKVDSGDGERWLDLINRLTKTTAQGTRVVSPDKTVKNGDVIKIGGTTFIIHHTGKAHTEGDIMIEIVEENALFLGDIVRNNFFGVMEEDSSFKGNIAAIDYLLNDAPSFKYYIPGHGKISDKELLRKYRTYLSTLYKDVKTMYETGLADFEMKPQIVKDLSAFKSWEGFDLRVGAHINRAYLEVESETF